ncbi:hypothetical protein ABIA96_005377 [Bradyrhizobium sp. LB11.1]
MTTLGDTIRPRAKSSEWKAIVILILLIPVLWSPLSFRGARSASPESIDPQGQAVICGYRSIHSGFFSSISRIFHSLRHFFSSFSRVIAVMGSS